MSIPAVLIQILNDVQLTRYLSSVGFAIVTYDTFLTLADEIQLVWPERWNLVKTLFYTNRIISYIFISINAYHLSGFAPSFSDTFCQVLVLTTGYGAIFTFAMTNWLLMTRAVALWGGTRTIVWTMTLFYLLTYIATITISTISSRSLVGHIFFLPTTHTCAISSRPRTFGAIWVPSILFDVVLFGMLFIKTWQHAHRMTGGAKSRLLRVLHRDGFIYFIVILGLRIFNLIAWATLDIALVFVGIFILWALTTVLLTRMHLNLKSIARNPTEHEEGEEEDIFDTTINFKRSTISFPRQARINTPLHRLPSNPSRGPSRASRGRRKGKGMRHDEESVGAVSTNIFPGGTRMDPNEDMYDYMTAARPNTGAGGESGSVDRNILNVGGINASGDIKPYIYRHPYSHHLKDIRYDRGYDESYIYNNDFDEVFDGSQSYNSHTSHTSHTNYSLQVPYTPHTANSGYTSKATRTIDSVRTVNTVNTVPTIRSLEPRPVIVSVTVDRTVTSERRDRRRNMNNIV